MPALPMCFTLRCRPRTEMCWRVKILKALNIFLSFQNGVSGDVTGSGDVGGLGGMGLKMGVGVGVGWERD